MNFSELFAAIKTKFQEHPEIMLNREELSVEIADVFDDRAFYILWKDQKCKVEPFHYHDHNVKIVASLRDIELLFTERQYLSFASSCSACLICSKETFDVPIDLIRPSLMSGTASFRLSSRLFGL